jgi:putative Holliday junction resolvase
MSNWLGIDHGHKRIGLAIGSETDGLALPVTVIQAEPVEQTIADICALAGEYNAAGLVVGLPLNMDGTIGPQAISAKHFAAELAQACELDVRLWDERLSSFQADADLAGHLTRKKRRARQDAIAAAGFLRDFLANDGPLRAPRPGDIDS